MSKQDKSLAPQSGAEDAAEWASPTGAPEEFGFPQQPNVRQLRCWENQERFLADFARCGIITHAAEATGVTVANVEWWDSQDTYGFKKRKAWAAQIALGHVEREIHRRALEGIDHPVIYKGEITTTYKVYSDNLLMFLTKKLDPTYRDNYTPPPKNDTPLVTRIIIHMPSGAGAEGQPQVEAESYQVLPRLHPELAEGAPVDAGAQEPRR